MTSQHLTFSTAARVLAGEARRLGLRAPAFRSPPQRADALRTIRRHADGTIVAVAVLGRPASDVAADLVEGVLVANGISGPQADACRRRLVAALDDAQRDGRASTVARRARVA